MTSGMKRRTMGWRLILQVPFAHAPGSLARSISARLGALAPLRIRPGLLCAALFLAAIPPALALVAGDGAARAETALPGLSAADRALYRSAFAAAEARDYDTALALVQGAENPLPGDVLLWQAIQDSGYESDFPEIVGLLRKHPDWPQAARLWAIAESKLPEEMSDAALLGWFAERSPQSGRAALRLIGALGRAGRNQEAAAAAGRTWRDLNFADSLEERNFLDLYGTRLTDRDHRARFNRLIASGAYGSAKAPAARLGRAEMALARALDLLDRRGAGVDQAVRAVPPQFQDHSALLYERARWRQRRGLYDGLVELLNVQPPADDYAGRWWRLRNWAVRRAHAEGRYAEAYALARDHGLTRGVAFAEGEWLAGWLALRYLGRPQRALDHFTHLYEGVSSPISRSRAAFWAGEARSAMAVADWAAAPETGQETGTAAGVKQRAALATLPDLPANWGAREWYAEAARFGMTYYGQMAARRLGREPGLDIARLSPIPEPDWAAYITREPLVIAALLAPIPDADRMLESFLRIGLAASPTVQELRLFARFAGQIGRPDFALSAAKKLLWEGILLPGALYPRLFERLSPELDAALVQALVRQESTFDPRAVSRAGARGLMQLMPATARHMARELNTSYRLAALTEDPAYNLALGQGYLQKLLERFSGSYILALAAYNAGPGRAERWIETYGDPRHPATDPVTWIESIPFNETRNYVQRILESVTAYRWLESGRDAVLPAHLAAPMVL